MHILVVGAGSIGKRHIKNLAELGVNRISVVDPDTRRHGEVGRAYQSARCYRTLGELVDSDVDAAVIATPPALHIRVACDMIEDQDNDIPFFIEKPVSHNLDRLDALEYYEHTGDNTWIVVGYSMRFHPAIAQMKQLLDEKAIGQPLYVRAEVGQYLPDWHPEEDYRDWYMAHEDQGGGALLDLSHEIDYLMWMFGDVLHSQGYVGRLGDITVDADDFADFQCMFGNVPKVPIVGSIHMDLLDRSYNRRCRIVGSEGTISWDVERGDVRCGEKVYKYANDRNIQFLKEMECFLASVKQGKPLPPLATLEDGKKVLEVVMDLKRQNGRA